MVYLEIVWVPSYLRAFQSEGSPLPACRPSFAPVANCKSRPGDLSDDKSDTGTTHSSTRGTMCGGASSQWMCISAGRPPDRWISTRIQEIILSLAPIHAGSKYINFPVALPISISAILVHNSKGSPGSFTQMWRFFRVSRSRLNPTYHLCNARKLQPLTHGYPHIFMRSSLCMHKVNVVRGPH